MSTHIPPGEASTETVLANYIRSRAAGAPISLARLCAENPSIASELEKLIPLMDGLMVELGSSLLVLPGGADPGGNGPEPAIGSGSKGLLERLSKHAPPQSRYRVIGELGRGGMGVVYRVWDEDLQRPLAMKVVLAPEAPATPIHPKSLGRFMEEAQVTGQLEHPGIVPVHELGLDARGQVYFTMRLVKGRDLQQILELVETGGEGWNRARALSVILKVCEAMSYAHEKGVIHRDLKPANVMVGRFGEVYVMDWGLARVLGQEDKHDLRLQLEATPRSVVRSDRKKEASEDEGSSLFTMDGDIVGTPAYMSPEQARGELATLGPATDIYAVGAILYHLLAGQAPYLPPGSKLSPVTVLKLLLEGPPKPVAELARDAPAELNAICAKSMAREPAERYASMQDCAEDLRAFLEQRVVRAYEAGAWAEARKWMVRNKALAGALVATVVTLILGMLATMKFASDAQAAAQREKSLADEAIELAKELRVNGVRSSLDELEESEQSLAIARTSGTSARDWWLPRARALIEGTPYDPKAPAEWLPGIRVIEQHLEVLRARALPTTPEQVISDRERRASILNAAKGELEWYSRMLGLSPWPSESEATATLDVDLEAEKGDGLFVLAGLMVDRKSPRPRVFGEELAAVIVARQALARDTTQDQSEKLTLLAQALFRTGQFDAALEVAIQARDGITDAEAQEEHDNAILQLESDIASWRDLPGRRERERERDELITRVSELEAELDQRLTFYFSAGLDELFYRRAPQLLVDLKRLEDRISIAEASLSPSSSELWSAAIEAIVQSPCYAGLRITPQLGLLPLGPDPNTGLWEFAHLGTGEPAQRGLDGQFVLAPQAGLVLVLLPGGSVPVQERRAPTSFNHVRLDPFFLSKYEMTVDQWMRVSDIRLLSPGDRMWPTEGVSYDECVSTIKRIGLWMTLPTEAQWEYACRGGTASAFWTGDDESTLADFEKLGAIGVNVADPSPIGTHAANPFGMHDIAGNAAEWCLDTKPMYEMIIVAMMTSRKPYGTYREGDGLLEFSGEIASARGLGRFGNAQSSFRQPRLAANRWTGIGLRPARGLTP